MKKKILFISLILSFVLLTNCGKHENENVNVNANQAADENENVNVNQTADENESENVIVNQTADKNEREYSFFGTWYISKAVLTSEMYTGTTLDGDFEENLYNPEDYLGFELEYSKNFFRLGDSIYYNPIYKTTNTTVGEVNDGNKIQPPDLYDLVDEEGIVFENESDYENLYDVPLVRFDVTFDSDIKYGKYDFIPVGTQCVLLNENTMLVGVWGKILLAYRQM